MHSCHIWTRIHSEKSMTSHSMSIDQKTCCVCWRAGAVWADRRGEPEGRAVAHLCQQTGSGHCIAGQRDRWRTQPAHLPGPPVADSGLLGCVWGGSPGQADWTQISWNQCRAIVIEAHLVPPLVSLKGWHELDLQQHCKQEEVNLHQQTRVEPKSHKRASQHCTVELEFCFYVIFMDVFQVLACLKFNEAIRYIWSVVNIF